MLNKKKFVIVGILIVIGLTFYITPIKGITRDGTISTVAEKDAYVCTYNPTSNYGGKDWLIFGNYISGWREAYLYFNFSDKPADWTKAEISIDMYSVSETFDVTACLINDTWDEYSINWMNKPEHREIITTFTVSEGRIYKIDITDYIEGRNSISICVNASNYLQTGYVQGHSREGYWSFAPEGAPQLIWTYPETAEITVTSPTSSGNWQDYNTYTITWTSLGPISQVIIQLYKGAIFVEDITFLYTDNDGDYSFYVYSSENYEGTDYRIKITDYDDANVYDYSDYFSINEGNYSLGYLLGMVVFLGIGAVLLIGVPVGIYKLYKKKTEERKIFNTQEPKDILAQKVHYCQNCGKEIIPNTRFCRNCGHDTSI